MVFEDAIEHEDSSSDETASSSHSFDNSSSSKVAAKPFHEEADVIQVMLAMARVRFEDVPRQSHFTIDVRGGQDTYNRFGMVTDGLRAEAAPDIPVHFCRNYRLQLSFACKLPLYEDEHAGILYAAWAHRMQSLFNVWRARGYNDMYTFVDADLIWAEPHAFSILAATGPTVVKQRCAAIRNTKPRAA